MREIKFRAWDGTTMHQFTLNEILGAVQTIGRGYRAWPSIDDTVLQFTGLHDKNDVDIFEGDLVKLDSWEGVQQIKFIEGAFCLADKEGDFSGDIHYIHHAGIEQAEVIGNIYEDPDLLERNAA